MSRFPLSPRPDKIEGLLLDTPMKPSALPDFSRFRWQRAARFGPLLVWGCALAVTGWVAADLFWRFNTPRPAALPIANPADPQQAALAIANRHLLGQSASSPVAGAPSVAAPSQYTVHAVVTGAGGRPGWAVLAVDGGAQQGYVEGQEIRAGVALTQVRGDGVELSIGGVRQNVALAERSAASAGAAANVTASLNLNSNLGAAAPAAMPNNASGESAPQIVNLPPPQVPADTSAEDAAAQATANSLASQISAFTGHIPGRSGPNARNR